MFILNYIQYFRLIQFSYQKWGEGEHPLSPLLVWLCRLQHWCFSLQTGSSQVKIEGEEPACRLLVFTRPLPSLAWFSCQKKNLINCYFHDSTKKNSVCALFISFCVLTVIMVATLGRPLAFFPYPSRSICLVTKVQTFTDTCRLQWYNSCSAESYHLGFCRHQVPNEREACSKSTIIASC